MKDTGRYRELSATQDELNALPVYNAEEGDGYFRGTNTSDGGPMVVKFVDDPLSDYPREVWYQIEINPAV